MMKKYMIAAFVSVVLLGTLTGCGLGGGKDIGKEEALEIALADAGAEEEDTTRLRVSTDRDDGRKIYEIQFDVNGKEYDYEIAARDGEIVSVDTETTQSDVLPYEGEQSASADGTAGQTGNTEQVGQAENAGGSEQNGNAGNGGNSGNAGQASGSNSNVDISQEQAIQIALERVPGATEADVRIELDYDDGMYKYEGDIIYERREYEFEINANTGTILEWSEERR